MAFDRLLRHATQSIGRPQRIQGGYFKCSTSAFAELGEGGFELRAGAYEVTSVEGQHAVGERDERADQGIAALRCERAPLLDKCCPGLNVALNICHHAGAVERLGPFEGGLSALTGEQAIEPATPLAVEALGCPEHVECGSDAAGRRQDRRRCRIRGPPADSVVPASAGRSSRVGRALIHSASHCERQRLVPIPVSPPQAAASPVCSSFSYPYSRRVSSIRNRTTDPCSSRIRIDFSTNDVTVSSNSSGSRSAPHTCSAASSSKLPANTASRPHTSCSSAVHNSKLQSTDNRNVCCRDGAPRLPRVSSV